ncbi:hypothetical protein [Falsiroseomonas stagni]|uniref:Uncharacterized protein n=1 Tax=Falsiroseomonas stagni DSM 19981 TaxID=1123062 RepID=A0A1I4BTG4_9PROT|nr:hypothetical protein [Falsiroseomonas stagni]SFK71181.1 hypothetical protein SAMN02745775_10656 [Falsiroseomonas stagni DSM 19981]
MNVINVHEPIGVYEAYGVDEKVSLRDPAPAFARAGLARADRPAAAGSFTLRRSGARPLSFTGRLVSHHSGERAGANQWHELRLYETDEGGFVADIRVLGETHGNAGQFHVATFNELEEALRFFETHDARRDVVSDIPIEDAGLSPAELMVHAATLKVRLAEAVSGYRAVLSAFLTAMHRS